MSRTLELGVTQRRELVLAVLRVLSEIGEERRAARYVAELERAVAAEVQFGPVRVEPARPLRRNCAAAQGRRGARRLVQRGVGLEEEPRVLPAIRRWEQLDEGGRVAGRPVACRPLRPVRAAVEVEVAVLEQAALSASGQVRLRPCAGPVKAGMGIAGVVAHRVSGLRGRAVRRARALVRTRALVVSAAGVGHVERVGSE